MLATGVGTFKSVLQSTILYYIVELLSSVVIKGTLADEKEQVVVSKSRRTTAQAANMR